MKLGKILVIYLGLMVATAWLAACGAGTAATQPAQTSGGGKLKVVATFSVLGDLVQTVGGDKIDLHTLVGPGGDTHTFEPSPSDSVALVEARLIFENGLQLETWFDDLYNASGSAAKRVVATEGIEPIAMAEGGHEHEEAGDHDEHAAEAEHEEPAEETDDQAAENDHEEHAETDSHGHTHGEFDPHVWHDVTNVIHEVELIRDALAGADPANAQSYQANAEAYLGQLQELDSWVTEEIKKIPADHRKLVTSHDTFGYFAKRYGLEVVGSGLGSISTETGDPSAAQVADLIEEIKAVGVPAIFTENVSNPKLMERVAAEAGVTLGPQLYTDALGEPGSEGETYLKMMRYNVTALVTALK